MEWFAAVVVVGMVVLLGMNLMGGRKSQEELERIAAALKKGARLVDVRTAQEFASGHLPAAVNIPLASLSARTRELGGKKRPVVLYCASGTRSRAAARILQSAGYTDVMDLGSKSNHARLEGAA